MNTYSVEYTDTFGGEANYCWVKRATVTMPDLTHYGYTGSADGSYAKAHRLFTRDLMRRAKAAVGLTGVRGRRERWEEWKCCGLRTVQPFCLCHTRSRNHEQHTYQRAAR